MFPRCSFFVLIVMLAHLGQTQADDLMSRQIANHNLMQEDQEMQEMQKRMSLFDATTTREPCTICENGANCEVVLTDFSREQMEEGYNYLATIPPGACKVTVIEKRKTKNNLALGWTLDKTYYFNGGWMIQQSGNYTAGKNQFTYNRPDDSLDDSARGDCIRFSTQLIQRIEVFLIVKNKNPGVKFSYVLPPIKHSQEKPKTEENRTTEKPKSNPTNEVAEELELHEDDRQMEQMAKVRSSLRYSLRRQAGTGDSLPDWIQDFASILKEWKKQLDNQIRIAGELKVSVQQLRTESSEHKRQIAALEARQTCYTGKSWVAASIKEGSYIYYGRTFPRTPAVAVSVGGFRTTEEQTADHNGQKGYKFYPAWAVSSITTSNFYIDWTDEHENMSSVGIVWMACI